MERIEEVLVVPVAVVGTASGGRAASCWPPASPRGSAAFDVVSTAMPTATKRRETKKQENLIKGRIEAAPLVRNSFVPS